MRMTRRTFKLGVLALGFAAAGGARHAAGGPSAAQLEADLSACLVRNPAQAAFRVPVFEIAPPSPDGNVRIEAQVQLDWAPGTRLRLLHATGPTTGAAYDALRLAAADLFVGVVPGFERPALAV